ncbi:MAG: small multi-drug export protein [Clostridia bacterium]|nr:small multi-drug export protein [Clostridia bacterium]
MDFLWTTFWGKLLMTFLVSMVPVIELRGAIPLAVAHGLDYRIAIPLAVLGNLVPVPFIIFYIKKIFAFIRKKLPKLNGLVDRLENRAKSKSETVQKSAFWGLFIFVAIPLPGTGAWTGALIAAMLDMRLKRAMPAIVAGVITAGTIVTIVTALGFTVFTA